MNIDHPTALPTPAGAASAPTDEQENSESAIEMQLMSEIRSLSESGLDPARLWKLKQTLDNHHLRATNNALALFPMPDQSGWPELQKVAQARLQSHQEASTPDRLDSARGALASKMRRGSNRAIPSISARAKGDDRAAAPSRKTSERPAPVDTNGLRTILQCKAGKCRASRS